MNAPAQERDSTYEAPQALRLGGRRAGAGACQPGSGDFYCSSGSAATNECDSTGNDAGGTCTYQGDGATGECAVGGMSAATCPQGSSAG